MFNLSRLAYLNICLSILSSGIAQSVNSFDFPPPETEQAFVRLYNGDNSAYAAYLDGPQPFVLSDGEPYLPLDLLLYLLPDHTQRPNKPIRDWDFVISSNTELRVLETDSGQDQLIVGQAHYDVEAFWLENDVYLPALTFLKSVNISAIWDPVTHVLTIPEAYPLGTIQFNFEQEGVVSVDSYPVFGKTTSVIVPSNIGTEIDESDQEYLSVSATSLLDMPVGLNFLSYTGGQLEKGHTFDTCFNEPCSVSYFLNNFRNTDESGIILLEFLNLADSQP